MFLFKEIQEGFLRGSKPVQSGGRRGVEDSAEDRNRVLARPGGHDFRSLCGGAEVRGRRGTTEQPQTSWAVLSPLSAVSLRDPKHGSTCVPHFVV